MALLIYIYVVPRYLKDFKPPLTGLSIFVFACGVAHLFEGMTAWLPIYRAVVLVLWVVVFVSFVDLLLIVYKLPLIKSLPRKCSKTVRSARDALRRQLYEIENNILNKDIGERPSATEAVVSLESAVTKLLESMEDENGTSSRKNG